MKTKLSLATVVAILSSGGFTFIPLTASSTEVEAPAFRNVGEYNLMNEVGLKGFDPVSYFPEGGAKPAIGNTAHKVDQEGVTYFFSTEANMQLFLSAPQKFEPSYGGWCAYAMSFGSKVDIKPNIYTISGNRLHFFVSQRAKQNFDADVAGHEDRADGFWKKISGEDPRR